MSAKVVIGTRAIVGFLLGVAFLLSMPVLYKWSLWVMAGVIVVATLGALLWGLLVRALGRGAPSRFLRPFVLLFALLTVLLAFPVYFLVYKVQVDPPVMPTVVLSDGKKTVVFQGMIHIGMEGFYKSVVYDLEAALSEGYRLYYEGVQPSPGEGDAWFSDHLAGGGDLAQNYQRLAEACGVQFQIDYFELLAADASKHPDRHVAADVSTLEMKQEYERLLASDAQFAKGVQALEQAGSSAQASPDMVALVLERYDSGNASQRALIGVLCRGALAIALSEGQKSSKPLDKVVLDFRNRKLVERILADDSDKIYITYGAAHLSGVVALLHAADSRWHVKSVKWARGLSSPEHFDGNLNLSASMMPDSHNKEE